jgi:hypothetical protein
LGPADTRSAAGRSAQDCATTCLPEAEDALGRRQSRNYAVVGEASRLHQPLNAWCNRVYYGYVRKVCGGAHETSHSSRHPWCQPGLSTPNNDKGTCSEGEGEGFHRANGESAILISNSELVTGSYSFAPVLLGGSARQTYRYSSSLEVS